MGSQHKSVKLNKMQLLLFFLLTLALSAESKSAPSPEFEVRDMSGIWRDFVEVTRLETVLAKMVELEASQDPYMLQVLTFLKGGKFEKISRWMWEDKNFKELYLFLRSNGVAMDEIFQWVADQLSIPFNPPKAKRLPEVVNGEIDSIKSLWDELITKIIPFEKYLSWVIEQYAINPDFIKLVQRLQASEAVKDRLNSSPEYQSYRCWMLREGIDLVSYETSACQFLEWTDCSTPGCENFPGWLPLRPTVPTTITTTTSTTKTPKTTTTTIVGSTSTAS